MAHEVAANYTEGVRTIRLGLEIILLASTLGVVAFGVARTYSWGTPIQQEVAGVLAGVLALIGFLVSRRHVEEKLLVPASSPRYSFSRSLRHALIGGVFFGFFSVGIGSSGFGVAFVVGFCLNVIGDLLKALWTIWRQKPADRVPS